MAQLITTLGPKNADEVGLILPHEHVFVDLRTSNQPGYAQADPTVEYLNLTLISAKRFCPSCKRPGLTRLLFVN